MSRSRSVSGANTVRLELDARRRTRHETLWQTRSERKPPLVNEQRLRDHSNPRLQWWGQLVDCQCLPRLLSLQLRSSARAQSHPSGKARARHLICVTRARSAPMHKGAVPRKSASSTARATTPPGRNVSCWMPRQKAAGGGCSGLQQRVMLLGSTNMQPLSAVTGVSGHQSESRTGVSVA